jgi:hypothetical protein
MIHSTKYITIACMTHRETKGLESPPRSFCSVLVSRLKYVILLNVKGETLIIRFLHTTWSHDAV